MEVGEPVLRDGIFFLNYKLKTTDVFHVEHHKWRKNRVITHHGVTTSTKVRHFHQVSFIDIVANALDFNAQ
jgi:hypothetical protein